MRSHLDLLVDLQQVRLTCCCAAIRQGHDQLACPACCMLCTPQQVRLCNTHVVLYMLLCRAPHSSLSGGPFLLSILQNALLQRQLTSVRL